VHNETISFHRKKQSYGKNNVLPIDEIQLQDFQAELNLATDEIDKHKLTYKVLDKMPLKYKECIVLKYFEGMSYEEISDILKIPEGTVAIRINRAKKIFKKIVTKDHISLKP
jgi:RNA polymerase sigma-70 factor (ECF subfamily)